MESLRGKLLVASPHLGDGNFFRSVVFMIQHDDSGAFGVILNRPTDRRLKDVLAQIGETETETGLYVNLGGPVSGPLIALHRDKDHAEMEIAPGLYFATRKDHILDLVRTAEDKFRVFSGYSGWSSGQLEGELETGSWMVAEVPVERLFDDDDNLWRAISNQIGGAMLTSALRIKHVPADPSMN